MNKLTKIRLLIFGGVGFVILILQLLDSGWEGFMSSLPYYGLLVGCVAVVLIIQFTWRLIFCQGFRLPKGKRFELSTFAEVVLHAFNVIIIAGIIYAMAIGSLKWYEYILPVLMCLLPIASSFNYFANRKDFIELAPGKATFMDQDKLASVEFANYEFYKAESDAISTSFSKANTWHLKLMGRGKAQIFDLKDMNLNGHKNAMERYLKSITAKQS
jgi:hypothetical protein